MTDFTVSATSPTGDASSLRERAIAALNAGDIQGAVDLMNGAIKLAPSDAKLRSEMGLIMEAAGDYDTARQAHGDALVLDPANPLHHYNMGVACQSAGKGQEAATHYVNAIEHEPLFAEAYFNLATLFYEAGHFDVAADHYRHALTARPDYVEAASNLGLCLRRQGKAGEAADCFRAAIQMRPDVALTHANLGIVLAEAGHYLEAIGKYEDALRLDPHSLSTHLNLSLALRGANRPEAAADAALKALTLKPDHTATQVELGSVLAALKRAGQEELARQVMDRWRALAGSHPVLEHSAAALGLAPAPARAATDYVAQVFDASAPRFDEMIGALDYRVPDLLGEALSTHCGPPAASLDMLDAGCGTGLAAPVLRPWARRLVGVDLSGAMLEQAARRGGYDQLDRDEIAAFMAARPYGFDAVTFGDVLCYFGDLSGVFQGLAATLRMGGHAVLTVEAAEPWLPAHVLRESGRYAHRRDYVEDALRAAGLTVLENRPVTLRQESGKPVEGLLLVARRA